MNTNGAAAPLPALALPSEDRRSHRVLLVDDSPLFLDILKSRLEEKRDPAWVVHTASNYSVALTCLKTTPMDLAILDIDMPVVDGLQLLTIIKRNHPSLPVALLSSSVKPESRQYALNQGAALVLDKKDMGADFESVYPALEASAARPVEGFEGMVRQVGLTEVLQLECLGRKSSVLEIKGTHAGGNIYISDGSIIHAETGSLVGVPALARLLGLKGGQFKMKPFTQPSRQSVEGRWEGLLLEASQASDEQAGQGQANGELSPAHSTDRRVEEVVLVSATGEILYKQNAPEADKRVTWLDSLATFSACVGGVFPSLGRPDRLEIRDSESRLICLFRKENKTFARLSVTPRQYADVVNKSSFQNWMETAAGSSAVLASGIRLSNHECKVQSSRETFPEAGISELAQCITEVIFTLRNCGQGCARLRWVFENGQIQSAQSSDDTIAFVATNNDPGVASAVEKLFSDSCLVESGK
jgi:CheY-like chemotaxis protein